MATINAEGAQLFWESGDREPYINHCPENIKTAAVILPTRSVAARWYNLMKTSAQSAGDLWIHREKEQLWWTTSKEDPPHFEPRVEPVNDGRRVVVCHKPCNPWSNENKNGNRLDWHSLHPRACEFLFTEGTLQMLGEDNAA